MPQRRIIIADDYEEMKYFLAETVSLFDRDAIIETVSTGEDLVKKVKHASYDLILTDNDMGKGIYGIEAIRQIREFNKEVTLYMISADD